ncbi:MAG: hypothetical protein IEMM0008_0410 [bacterium]|nr:MAG: hypothetical protein IEMM0008_0410 [bacterium]
MANSIKDKKLLYHLTSLENIDLILKDGLCSRNSSKQFVDVGEPDIIKFREEKGLNDYIPFHFFCGNPFDGAVLKSKTHSDKDFIYICIYRDNAKKENFKIIPMHPNSMKPLQLYDYSEGFDLIEWDKMELRDYSDQKCKHICMAECLSQKTIPSNQFFCIYVQNKKVQSDVSSKYREIHEQNPSFHINVNSDMLKRD